MNPTDTLLRTRDGDPPVVDALRRAMRGRVVAPSDPDWDDARAAWNLSADQRPDLVAFPADATDVQLVVHHAAEHGLRVAPQSTGHAALTLDCDGAVLWNDPDIGIDWGIPEDDAILSEKDAAAQRLAEFDTPFVWEA